MTELAERNNPSEIERIVMRRVRVIRILALVISTVTLAVLTSLAALWGLGREVWVARVFENMPPLSDFSAFASFWLAAYEHTRLFVQVLTLLTITSFAFLLRELARLLSSYFSSAAA